MAYESSFPMGAAGAICSLGRLASVSCVVILAAPSAAPAQDAAGRGRIEIRGVISDEAPQRARPDPAAAPGPQRGAADSPVARTGTGQITAVALTTDDGQRIDRGVIWRIYQPKSGAGGKPKLIAQHRDAAPVLRLQAGEYLINAAYGQAYVTRRITVQGGREATEKFVLNAGALRVKAVIGAAEAAAPGSTSYDIYSDERDQFGQRTRIVHGAKPGVIYRLNSGLYHIESRYGDVNVAASSDVTVEPGKLTEATISHAAAKVTFKLVTRSGGEALADTQWSIATPKGEVVKESVGALPTHMLAPGTYAVSAKSAGRVFQRTFKVRGGETTQVEVLIQ
jgi:hypothetical protein